jgi:cell division protein ZapE
MTPDQKIALARLVDRSPSLSGTEIAAQLVPPRQFQHATLDNYVPDADYPSQSEAVEAVRGFLQSWKPSGGGLFSRRKATPPLPGLYLDGGFGVGKTHLLAALWHGAPGRKYFGTFIEYTALIGALGYQQAVQLLRGATLIAIDEFELDDPGDTMMMTRMLGELIDSGSRVAATSNTPPNALGEGRFAASDFLREIHAMSSRFRTIRIDGLDYRRRAVEGHAVSLGDAEFESALKGLPAGSTVDDFDAVLSHLATIHPSKYVKLVEGLPAIALKDVRQITAQTDALRLVAFIDRLYDDQVEIVASGTPLDQVFADDMLGGGYRKKYLRAISRMIALTTGQPQ